MKILYCGPYRDNTGYGHAAVDYILAMDSVGLDVVCRPLKLNNYIGPVHPRILELEQKSSRNATHSIQHSLPQHFCFDGRLKSIGLFASETSDYRASVWPDRLNCMDEAWVINRQMAKAAERSGVHIPLKIIPHATDIEKYQRSYPMIRALKSLRKDKFLFYFISEFSKRKNLLALLKAFYLTFKYSEPVELIIKTSIPGLSPDETKEIIEKHCADAKEGLKLRDYKSPIVITHELTDDDVMSLHSSCDCLVAPSFGEAWGISAFNAMAFGKTPIVTATGGYLDYLSDKEGWLVPGREEPVFGMVNTFKDLYLGTETWTSIDVLELGRCMREAYEKPELRAEKARNGIRRAYDFSYPVIGEIIKKGLLENGPQKRPRLARSTR